jgi:hypothetical protein
VYFIGADFRFTEKMNLPQEPMLGEPNPMNANRALGHDFFEGVVMKRADSIYPVQLRSATEEGWGCKHRFVA